MNNFNNNGHFRFFKFKTKKIMRLNGTTGFYKDYFANSIFC